MADGDVHFPLRAVLAETLKNLPVEVENEARLLDEVADFFAQRAKNMLLDKASGMTWWMRYWLLRGWTTWRISSSGPTPQCLSGNGKSR